MRRSAILEQRTSAARTFSALVRLLDATAVHRPHFALPLKSKAHSGPLFRFILCLVTAIGVPAETNVDSTIGTADGPGNRPKEKFKLFLVSPPVIQSAIFSVRFNPDQNWPTQFLNCRWQSNAILLSQYNRKEDALSSNNKNALDAVSRWDNHYWDVFGRKHDLTIWEDKNLPAERENPVLRFLNGKKILFVRLMNMGLPWADIGQVTWIDDNVYFQDAARGITLAGKLLCDDKGFPKRLQYTVRSAPPIVPEPRAWEHIVQYFYDRNIGVEYLPSRVRCSLMKDGRPSLLFYDYEIYSLQTSSIPMTKDAFAPPSYLISNLSRTFYVSNKFKVFQNESGNWDRVRSPEELPLLKDPSSRSALYYIGAILILSLPLVLYWKIQLRTKQKI